MVNNTWLTETGGTPFEDRTNKAFISEDCTDTLKILLQSSVGVAQSYYQILQANNVFDNKDFALADEFTDADGTNNTVNTTDTDSWFDTDLYKLSIGTDEASADTLSDPDGFTDPTNAFDSNDTTFAEESNSVTVNGGTGHTYSIGKTFSSKTVKYVEIKASQANTTTSISSTEYSRIYLQSYNGSTWTTIETYASENFGNGGTSGGTSRIYEINATCQGLRILFSLSFENSGGNNVTQTCKLYTLEYSTMYSSSNSVIIDANTLTLDGTEKSIAIYTDATNTSNTSIGVKAGDGTTQTSEATMLNNGVVMDISSLSSGTLELEFIERTTDTSETPQLKGYSCVLIR